MTEKRIILEMGAGNDLYGGDYTKAACRAVQD
ncbi:MAG: Lin0512 family protein, partial [Proteobacteria bacterium]|nr:Lin0512 family protein [Pseudomonadota bacterium]